jgi:hypothetical protein
MIEGKLAKKVLNVKVKECAKTILSWTGYKQIIH